MQDLTHRHLREAALAPSDGLLSRRAVIGAAATGGLVIAASLLPAAGQAKGNEMPTPTMSRSAAKDRRLRGSEMPTYVCNTQNLNLDRRTKAAIAHEIASIHHDITGAPVFFVQVIFNQLATEDHYIGGAAQDEPQVFVRGDIRSGRSDVDLQRLLAQLVDGVAGKAGLKPTAVWVYLAELAPTHMAEFGHMLPPAGGEAAWLAALPAAERAHMEQNGVSSGFTL